MAQKPLDRQKLAALVRRWERVRDPKSLVSVAVQTAAALSYVHDVPSEVLEALDSSIEMFGEKCGNVSTLSCITCGSWKSLSG